MSANFRSTLRHLGVRAAWLLALPILGAGCSGAEGDAPDTEASDLVRIVNVEVTSVSPTSFEEIIRLTGEVEAEEDVILSAQEGGKVTRIFVEKGARIRKGQPLLKIDDRLLRAELAQAQADSELAHQAYERQKAVWANKIGAELTLLERKRAFAAAVARLEGLHTRLSNTTIDAPFDGLLEERFVEENETAAAGSPVLRVLNVARLKIDAGVPERFAPDVRSDTRASVTFDVLPGRVIDGRVGFVGNAVDRANRTFPVEIFIDNPEGFIKPAMIANVRLVRRSMDVAIVVPQEAIRYTEEGYVAYVAKRGEQGPVAERRDVQVGPSYNNQIVIESGLNTGDRLITRGQLLVAEGTRIEIVEAVGRALP